MSFRMFIYYCALCGAWSALVGWMFGRMLAPGGDDAAILYVGVMSLFLGMMIALGLSLVDALWVYSLSQPGAIARRAGVAVLVGTIGGFMGGVIGQGLYDATGRMALFQVFGWIVVGTMIGASIGVYDLVASLRTQQNLSFSIKKMVKASGGGLVGGLLGSLCFLLVRWTLHAIFSGRDPNAVWSPQSFGFVVLGACIGLLIGLAQVVLKEAWLKVEAGFRPGREMILGKDLTVIGRAEGSDIGLFGDMACEKYHARIILDGNRYYLEDNNTPGGTFLNDQQIAGRTPLQAGDVIRVGKSVLRFRERPKKR